MKTRFELQLTKEEKAKLQHLANLNTNGNISALIRMIANSKQIKKKGVR